MYSGKPFTTEEGGDPGKTECVSTERVVIWQICVSILGFLTKFNEQN